MVYIKHPSNEQIVAYGDDTLKKAEALEIGRHLTSCADCLKLLPKPTVEQFKRAIFGKSKKSSKSPPFNNK